eukprot:1048743-Prymnesium_polylepis.1
MPPSPGVAWRVRAEPHLSRHSGAARASSRSFKIAAASAMIEEEWLDTAPPPAKGAKKGLPTQATPLLPPEPSAPASSCTVM